MRIVEQDAGLWQVFDRDGNSRGFICDDGQKVSGLPRTSRSCYYALRWWNNRADWKTGNVIGVRRHFMKAAALCYRAKPEAPPHDIRERARAAG
jgi:hypothetical protein